MKILVTGASGFIGKNLVAQLKNIAQGKDRTHGDLFIDEIMEFDAQSSESELENYLSQADFVFHLAGVNRPKEEKEFAEGNCDLTAHLLTILRQKGNHCPVMLASSKQATLEGRYSGSAYGSSKKQAEELLFEHARLTGAKALIYRFPNVFGKWCRPNYNSAVATFCYNIARDLPITVSDPDIELELVYIDDLVEEMLHALTGKENHDETDPRFCRVKCTHTVRLGQIVSLLRSFRAFDESISMLNIPASSFESKLYSTFVSYLPAQKAAIPFQMNKDQRGSFTEIMRCEGCGQFSVNISKPGVTKGEHWHHSKWELFVVVSGHGIIRLRKIGSDEITEFEVSSDEIQGVYMLPGYTHSIVNLSDTQDLVTLMWANESFNKDKPDTYYEAVDKQ